jgi:hypothetical protein
MRGWGKRFCSASRKLNGLTFLEYWRLVMTMQDETEVSNAENSIAALIENLRASGKLIRLNIVKERGVRMSIPGRIINYDPALQNISVYHVDEKQVYLINLNEVEHLKA